MFKKLLFSLYLISFVSAINAASVLTEETQYLGTNGKPIVNGSIYIGSANADPEVSPITIYSDRVLSTVLANPQTTDSYGRAVNKIYVPGRYSIKVEDSAGVQRFLDPDAGEEADSGTTALTNVQGSNTITAEGSPAVTTLTDKEIYIFKAASANTGAVTLQIDSTAAKDVLKYGSTALAANDILANSNIFVEYNSTADDFIVLSELPLLGTRFVNQFETGDITQSMRTTKTGWLLMYGQTIGDVGSGADMESASYEDVYDLLWTNCADAECAVSTGRGASNQADWDAGETLTLPDARGRVLLGKDNMGGSSANVVTNASADTLGDLNGAETHTLTSSESGLPAHNHGITMYAAGSTTNFVSQSAASPTGGSSTTQSSSAANASSAHNNMQPYLTINTFIKY